MGATSHALWSLPHSYNVLAWGQSLQMFLEFNLLGAGKLSGSVDLLSQLRDCSWMVLALSLNSGIQNSKLKNFQNFTSLSIYLGLCDLMKLELLKFKTAVLDLFSHFLVHIEATTGHQLPQEVIRARTLKCLSRPCLLDGPWG